MFEEMDNGSIITRFSDLEPGSYDIKGRTGFKSTTQSFEGYNGETKYFFFILFEDKTTQQQPSTPIRVCAYARDYVRFFFTIRPDKLYILRNVTITENINKKAASKLHVKLTRDSIVEEILEREKLSFVRLNLVEPQYESDLIGVINEISDTVFTNTRDGRLTCRRNVIIVDESLHWLSVTVWGDQAKEFKGTRGDVFVTAKAFITPYNGKSAQAKGTVFLNPEIVETKRLKDWFTTLGEDPKFIPPEGNSRSDQARISASEQMVKMECDSG